MLADVYGTQSVKYSGVAHFSYHVADDYDLQAVRALLERAAASLTAFTVPVRGFGIVTGGVWLNLTRTPVLSEIHASLWADAAAAGTGVEMRYHPGSWFPHVTLAQHDAILDEASVLASTFRAGKVPGEVCVDNLSVIEETATGHVIVFRVPLQRESET